MQRLGPVTVSARRPKTASIYTDCGSQYCSYDYQKILRQHGFKVSMSGKGNCYGNAASRDLPQSHQGRADHL
ncbi:Integrase core domain protein [Pelagimonas varians]|uniref:Integrase core domain protein n=1 Tax=Pelagimonas varians TaxID=696760 RepID=A0A238L5U8_9RHOB|nr:Integrase core domain protein [Pelagimonas varians]